MFQSCRARRNNLVVVVLVSALVSPRPVSPQLSLRDAAWSASSSRLGERQGPFLKPGERQELEAALMDILQSCLGL